MVDLFLFGLFLILVGRVLWDFIQDWQILPPGPWGLPIVGYLPFINKEKPHYTLQKLSKKFGPIYGLRMGSVYTVVISDHKLIRETFSRDIFSGRAPLYLTHGIMQGHGIICAEGKLWKDQRKLLTTWLKGLGVYKYGNMRHQLETRIGLGVDCLIDELEKLSGKPINFTPLLTNYLGNVINEITFGFKFPTNDKTWAWFRHIQEEGCHEMGVAGVVNFLPFFRYFSPSIRKTISIIKRGIVQTHRLYASIIKRRRDFLLIPQPQEAVYLPHVNLFKGMAFSNDLIKCIKYSKYTQKPEEHFFDSQSLILYEGDCILDNFLKEQYERFSMGSETACHLIDRQLYYFLADIFGASLDTTSTTIAWFLLYMAIHTDEQELIREEIFSVCRRGEVVDDSRLPRLMAAFCETQRIRSVVPVGIPHGCVQDTHIRNYKIPKGTMVICLQWALHMDPDVWENPDVFKPSRFLAPDGSLSKPPQFIPFQTGKRICPGDELARMIFVGFATRLLQSKRVLLSSEMPSPEKMEGTVGLTLSPPKVEYCFESL